MQRPNRLQAPPLSTRGLLATPDPDLPLPDPAPLQCLEQKAFLNWAQQSQGEGRGEEDLSCVCLRFLLCPPARTVSQASPFSALCSSSLALFPLPLRTLAQAVPCAPEGGRAGWGCWGGWDNPGFCCSVREACWCKPLSRRAGAIFCTRLASNSLTRESSETAAPGREDDSKGRSAWACPSCLGKGQEPCASACCLDQSLHKTLALWGKGGHAGSP